MLPLRYALRNLRRRGLRTALTLAGVALISLLVILMAGFATGLDESVANSARDDVAILVGVAQETDLVRSFVPFGSARVAAESVPGVAVVNGRRAASIELHSASRFGDRVALLRGVTPGAYLVHPQVVVVEGVEPRGPYEVMVGRLAHARLGIPDADLAPGRTIRMENRDWRITGRFAAPRTVLEAEIWGRLEDVMDATRRVDVSAVAVRLADPGDFKRVDLFANQRVGLEMKALRSSTVFEAYRATVAPVATLAWLMAGLVLVGGVFACSNTMFAAVLARTREMGTLRAVGYGPLAVATSLLEESLILGALGGALGFAAASLLGEVALRFPMGAFTLDLGGGIRFLGLAAALATGLFGGLFPAARAVRLPLPEALGGKV
jgi:ABC-type antimicrobial peptide transport system permease subunit